ncbi:MAG TPA: hypothetical protein VIW29_02915, partial [Polyangiaceae bacterium]
PGATVDQTPQVAEEPPDLSPVTRPSEVVVVGRIAHPRQLVETLAQWSSLPFRVEDLVPSQARGLSQAVLWDAPVEALVALDAFGDGKLPPPLMVASLGVKSLAAGLSAAEAMQIPARKLAPGVYRVGDLTDGSCALAASVGSSPARLVCGRTNRDVDTLLPYATRGLPSEAQTGADFELTLDAKPIHQRYGREVSALRLLAGVAQREVALDSPRFDRALSDALYGAVDETINLFGDLDQIRLQARLDTTQKQLLGSAELRLRGDSSWLAGTIAATKPAELPTVLPRLPPDATLACYSTALPAERYTAIARILADLSEGFLEHEKLPPATRKRARHLLESWFTKLPESFGFAMSPSASDPLGYLHADTMLTRLSEPSARVLGAYGDFFALLSDPALKRWLKQKAKVDEKLWPKVSRKPLKLPGFKQPATAFEATFDGKALASADPSIGKMLENLLPPADAKQLSRITIVVQPDGEYTYVLTGDDTREMSRVMGEHKKAESGAKLLKPARSGKIVAAGFLTLAYVGRHIERLAKDARISKAIASTPQHGATPIPFSSTTAPGSARLDLEIPAAVFSDASAAAVQAGPALKDAIEKR